MRKKAVSIWFALLLVLTIYSVILMGNVTAMNDDQNLSGLIWQNDGSFPTQNTTFCIWVEHAGFWFRFPETGWAYTEMGVDGTSWYSYVLPNEDYPDKWAHGDIYRVQVNGEPWGEYNGNTTSNGTGSLWDPVPPLDLANPASTYNTINYSAGGGFANEQQWDVRTVAPIDLAPTNITVNGLSPDPSGIPVGPKQNVTLIFNITNLGLVPTGRTFNVTIWNCSATGQNNGSTPIWEFLNIGPLNEYGNTSGSGYDMVIPIPVIWTAHSLPGIYYINITVDSDHEISESNEINNTFILIFKIGPDLIPTNVLVDFQLPTDPIYVGPGDLVRIDARAINIGNSPTGADFFMAIYNITGPNGPIIPGDMAFSNNINELDVGETSPLQTWLWTAHWDAGDHYVNITVDYGDLIPEGNENNNTYTLHFYVGPDLVPNNVSVNNVLIVDYIIITPLQTATIGVNASNIGITSTGVYTFRITFTNCSVSGDTGGNTPFYTSTWVGPVSLGGFSQDVFAQWIMPFNATIFDYYINITIDFYDEISEINENNNYYILNLKMDAPDLTFNKVSLEVDGINATTYSSIPPYVSAIEEVPSTGVIVIWIEVINVGGVNITETTNVSFYNVSGLNGPPIDTPFWNTTLPPLNAKESVYLYGIWPNPGIYGMYYINISIDYNGTLDLIGKILELNEFNNTFTFQINVTPLPVTTLNRGTPSYQTGSVLYINSSTELNLTTRFGVPPYYTWYRIAWTINDTDAKPWTNYTLEGRMNFTMTYGEDTFTIYFYSIDSAGGIEGTKQRIIIVDDSPPITNISFGNPQYRANPSHTLNISSATPITLIAVDLPPGNSSAGPGILNASGINAVPRSGIFYRVQREDNSTWMWQWRKASIASIVNGVYTSTEFKLPLNPLWLDGFYIIEYNSTDNLVQKETTKSRRIYLDNTGPLTTIIVGDPKYPHPTLYSFVKSSTRYNLSAYESIGSGANLSSAQYRIWYNDVVPRPTSGWRIGRDFDIATTFILDGNYTLEFRTKDNLGNFGPTGNISVYVDDTPPPTILNFGNPKYRANINDILNITSNTSLNLTADDGIGSGLKVIQYRIHNSTFDTGWITYTNDFTFDSDWSDGIYTLEFNSTDNLGNVEETNTVIINLDNTPPAKILTVGIPRYRENDALDIWNITSATSFNLYADDGLGCGVNHSQYRIYNSTFDLGWVTYTGDFTFSSDWADGIYTLEYNSTDYLGNDLTNTTIIYLDNNGPITTITWPHTQNDWNTAQNAWNINFSVFFRLIADDGMGSGVEHIEYRISRDDGSWTAWQNYINLFNLTLNNHGYWRHTIQFRSFDNLGNLGPTGNLDVYIEGDITPPLPPILRLRISGDDVVLEWEPSPDLDIDHYLIYKSTTKTGFDFSEVWVDTSNILANGVDPVDGLTIPLRTTWNDTGAVSDEPEFYYTMRGVDIRGNIGYTSNIAGKVTMNFEEGYNDFALPLEPFEEIRASKMLSHDVFTDDSDTVYRYDTGIQQWMGHPKFLPANIDDFALEMGEGYMLHIAEDVEYTFTGSVGTAIRYIGGVGQEDEFRNSLIVAVQGNDVTLSWEAAEFAIGYSIYRASARMDLESLTDYTIESVAEVTQDITSWTDSEATGDEYYYMVVAMDGDMERSGTYAVGIKKFLFKPGYRVFSMELEPKIPSTIAWFATDMFSLDSDTLYYYNMDIGTWNGHPKFVPENINNVKVSMGSAYIAYVHDEDVYYVFNGI